jgi:hypothetical protein
LSAALILPAADVVAALIDIAGVAPPVEDIGAVPVTLVTVPWLGVNQIVFPVPSEAITCPLLPRVPGRVNVFVLVPTVTAENAPLLGVVEPIAPGDAHAVELNEFDNIDVGTLVISVRGRVEELTATSRYGVTPSNTDALNASSLPEPVPSVTEYKPLTILTVFSAAVTEGHN